MKVHFADKDSFGRALPFLNAGVRYTLQTYYYINKSKHKLAHDYETLNRFNHIIIDSGLFAIMFGCEKDSHFDEKRARQWMSQYISFINESKFKNASYVECDVQKKLGPEIAWEFREEMRAKIPREKGSIINVYHLEDGNPDKLIDYADYIAVSIPELRFNVSKKERYSITRYISQKATRKGKRVHLLGCTEKQMMKEFNYCYSCDSTSYSSGVRWNLLKSEIIGEIEGSSLFENSMHQYKKKQNKAIETAVRLYLADYTKYAGDQS